MFVSPLFTVPATRGIGARCRRGRFPTDGRARRPPPARRRFRETRAGRRARGRFGRGAAVTLADVRWPAHRWHPRNMAADANAAPAAADRTPNSP